MSRSRYTLPFDLRNMVPAPDGKATVQSIFRDEDGIMIAYGTTKPTDGTSGYEIGCLFIHTDGSATGTLYVNEGSETSCDFNAVTTAYADTVSSEMIADDAVTSAKVDSSLIQTASKTFTATEIRALGTAVDLVPAPGAGKAIEFISAYLFLDYSGGDLSAVTGNIRTGTMNQGAFANTFISASADRVVISHCGAENDDADTYFINTSLNIKLASNPTGAGSTSTLTVKVSYRIHDFS